MISGVKNVSIPDDVLKKIEDLQPARNNQRVKFKPWMDQVILENYYKYRKSDLSKILGVSEYALGKRYAELTEGE